MSFWEKLHLNSKKASDSFTAPKFEELIAELNNPSRGWFRIIHFNLAEDPSGFLNAYFPDEACYFDLVIMEIGAYKVEPVSAEGLAHMRAVLDWYRMKRREIILRVTYDHEGKAMEREPFFFKQVCEHMEQVAEVLRSYTDIIYVYQGLLVGSWGEMHSSRFLYPDKLNFLKNILENGTDHKLRLAVRKPVQWRLLHEEQLHSTAVDAKNMGLFDDAILGSESDLGTFGTKDRTLAGWDNPWNPQDELDFQEKISEQMPNGGEVIAPADKHTVTIPELAKRLKKMHISYLNRYYDKAFWDEMEEKTWSGNDEWHNVDGLTYISRHLGYRYCVRNAFITGKAKYTGETYFAVEIENVGFAGLYEPVAVYIQWSEKDGNSHTGILTEDLSLKNGQNKFTLPYTFTEPAGEVKIFMERRSDKRRLYFANVSDEQGRVTVGNFADGE